MARANWKENPSDEMVVLRYVAHHAEPTAAGFWAWVADHDRDFQNRYTAMQLSGKLSQLKKFKREGHLDRRNLELQDRIDAGERDAELAARNERRMRVAGAQAREALGRANVDIGGEEDDSDSDFLQDELPPHIPPFRPVIPHHIDGFRRAAAEIEDIDEAPGVGRAMDIGMAARDPLPGIGPLAPQPPAQNVQNGPRVPNIKPIVLSQIHGTAFRPPEALLDANDNVPIFQHTWLDSLGRKVLVVWGLPPGARVELSTNIRQPHMREFAVDVEWDNTEAVNFHLQAVDASLSFICPRRRVLIMIPWPPGVTREGPVYRSSSDGVAIFCWSCSVSVDRKTIGGEWSRF